MLSDVWLSSKRNELTGSAVLPLAADNKETGTDRICDSATYFSIKNFYDAGCVHSTGFGGYGEEYCSRRLAEGKDERRCTTRFIRGMSRAALRHVNKDAFQCNELQRDLREADI